MSKFRTHIAYGIEYAGYAAQLEEPVGIDDAVDGVAFGVEVGNLIGRRGRGW